MMRITTPHKVTLTEQGDHALTFTGERGEVFQVFVLDEGIVRVRHLPDGTPRLDRTWAITAGAQDVPLTGRARDDLSGFALPPFRIERDGTRLTVRTARLAFTIDCDDFHITWLTADGTPFAADLKRRAYAYDRAGRTVYHYMARRTHEHYYGFGESAGSLDKQRQQVRMRSMDALGYNAETGSPLYKHIPFYITYEPQCDVAYGLFYDNAATCTFDMGREVSAFWGFYRYYQADDGDIDYYMLYGADIAEVLARYAWLTGKPTLPPRWSLGYLGSTMSYTEAADAQEQLKQFVALCQQHDIPCDLFHLSSGYTTDARGLRYVFTWNRDKVPDPAAMVQSFHDAGIQLAANIKPYLLTSHPAYAHVAAAGGFIKQAEDDAPIHSSFWSGGAFESDEGSYIDFTSEAGFRWWQAQIKAQLLAYDIDALWNDNNEFEIWDDTARCDGFGRAIPIGQARPLQTLLMGRASYEALREARPTLRPFVLTRSGSAGIQRYAQTWSGDNETSWHTLRYNIPMGLSLGLSGVPNNGHDVGGFYGDAPSPELFVRWVQNGIFHPRFTIHSWNTDGTVNEAWMYPEVLPLVRAAIRLRYRLVPYLYTLFYESAQTGQPITRPLVYHFAHDPRCRTASFEFMLGAWLLVASVLEEGARTRMVYLPAGANWYDWHTGALYAGGQEVTLDAPLERAPLLARAGGIVPLARDGAHSISRSRDHAREVYVFPARDHAESQFVLVEDDGVSMAYQEGGVTFVTLTLSSTPDALTLGAQARGGYPLPYDALDFVLPQNEARLIVGTPQESLTEDGRRRVRVNVTFA